MATYRYLKYGSMRKRPFHLVAEDEVSSLCGVARLDDVGAMVMSHAPTPMDEAFVCVECRRLSPLPRPLPEGEETR